jgi:hypothetical protein
METNAWHYREAERTIGKTQSIGRGEAIAIAEGTDKVSLSLYLPEVRDAIAAIEAAGKYAYNSDVASAVMRMLGMETTNAAAHGRMESIVYGSRQYIRAEETLAKYRRFWDAGYISIHDVSDADDGRTALLSGTASVDLWTLKKDDEKVRIVAKGDMRGYMKPRMRTRYFRAAVDSDLFVKII